MNESLAVFSVKIYTFLLPIAWLGVAIVILLLLPLSIFRKARPIAGTCIVVSSYLFGVTTWFLGASITFATWGWIGLIIGLLLAGIGVVPIGILSSFISLGEFSLGISLIVMVIVVAATRFGGLALLASVEDL